MNTLLLYPPITDPTSGYHSLCYLETYAREQGFSSIDIVDVNIEALLYTLQPEHANSIVQHFHSRRTELEASSSLNQMEQLELFHLWRLDGLDNEALQYAVEVMRDPVRFFEYSHYRYAVEILMHWMGVLSSLGYPGQFSGFSLPTRHLFNLSSSQDMASHEVCAQITKPFLGYLQNKLMARIQEVGYRVVGLNVTYTAQLPFALTIARMIRQQFPEIVIFFGGTEVADVWKYAQRKTIFFEIFDAADACVIGEGEAAFTELLHRVENNQPFVQTPNTLVHPRHGVTLGEPEIKYYPIASLTTPDYSKLPWEKYLSPYSYVYYSPSRGCYWNKCTFCDYGLNFESPTSPWRQNPVDKIYEDLQNIAKQGHTYIYFSVDVLAPALLLNLAEKILEEPLEKRLDIRWGAEVRLETYWSPERCLTLKKAGCTDISVGYESGNQRILDLIDKGTKVDRIRETIENFTHAGIGVQMMGFTGFPTETYADAMESVHFLEQNREYWTFGGLGSFSLTPGAIVAKEPERFAISDVRPYTNEDIVRSLSYASDSNMFTAEEHSTLEKAKGVLSKSDFNRPFVGGVDTGHTMYYHDRFGTSILQALQTDLSRLEVPNAVWVLNGRIVAELSAYPFGSLFNPQHLHDLHTAALSETHGLTSAEILEYLQRAHLEADRTQSQELYFFVRTDGMIYPFSQDVLAILAWFDGGKTMYSLLEQVPESQHDSIRKLITYFVQQHFIRGNLLDRELHLEVPVVSV